MAEKVINGKTFSVNPMLAEDAFKLMAEIIRLTGPAAKFLPSILSVGLETEDLTPEEKNFFSNVSVLNAYSEMIAKFGEAEFVQFKKTVIELASIRRPSGAIEQVDLNGDFTDDLKGAEEVFNFVLKEQFGNFSQGSGEPGPFGLAMLLVKNVFLNAT